MANGGSTTLVLKRFDAVRGFGFADDLDAPGRDVLVHIKTLNAAGFSEPVPGMEITGIVKESPRGLRLVEAEVVVGPDESSPEPPLAEGVDATAPIHPARLQWFDKARGFGFVRIFGNPTDVFLHIDVLDAAGMAPGLPGSALAVQVRETERGLAVARAFPWSWVAGHHAGN